MSIKINVSEMEELEGMFSEMPGVLEAHVQQGAHIAGAEVQSAARAGVAVDTGALKMSIENKQDVSPMGVITEVGPTQPYGKDIEFGTPPGRMVPVAALSGWAKRKGISPYAVQWAIYNKGTRPQPFLFPAFDAKEGSVFKIMQQAVLNAINQVFGK